MILAMRTRTSGESPPEHEWMQRSMAAQKKPNVLLILADAVGWFDVGAYHLGIMGAPTSNIDRVTHDGVMLTDCYAQASCKAGRAAFITGQIPMRTGLTTVGLPGAPQGLQPEAPTLAELLKPQGYMTAQIGKNHLGDRNPLLPTVHGFDEFYGNLTISMPMSRLSRSFSNRAAYRNAKRPIPTIPRKTLALDE
jgi:arylsulfatase A-like enzyme